ncbi:MAG: DUF6713 family protein [Bacteroidota bacterium]
MIPHLFFYVGFSFFLAHQMDAIRCKEWRIIPLLSLLEDDLGYIVFLFAHIPIAFVIFSQLTHGNDIELFIKNFDIFMVLHIGLHFVFVQHQNNRFNNWISWILILSAGIMGLTDLLVK